MDRNNALTDPKKLVRVELKNAGFDIDKIKIPDTFLMKWCQEM